jgi:Recombination endonuclease VII
VAGKGDSAAVGTWPQMGSCAQCGNKFERWRPQNLYCKSKECKSARQRVRWERWRDKKEEAGTFRDDLNQYQQAYRERTGYARDWELRNRYGITLQEWLAMVNAVDGKCEICGDAEEVLCVDHCHETGQIRGVLCRRCNRAIGQLGDSLEAVRKAVAYLERTK